MPSPETANKSERPGLSDEEFAARFGDIADHFNETAVDPFDSKETSKSTSTPKSTEEIKREIEENALALGIPDVPQFDAVDRDSAKYNFPASAQGEASTTQSGQFAEGDQFAMFDAEGNANPDLSEQAEPVVESQNKPINEYSVAELRAALAEAEARESAEAYANNPFANPVAEQAEADERHLAEAQAENPFANPAAEKAEADERHAAENAQSLDSMDRVTNTEPTNYNTRIAQSTDRLSKWLTDKADRYENVGGIKGFAKKLLRRLGSAAYRRSGLKATVEGVKKVGRGIENAADKTFNSIDNAIDRAGETKDNIKNAINKRREEAKKRSALRERAKNIAKERRKLDRAEAEQAKREQDVMDYVEGQKDLDPADENRKEAKGRHRKANENKERRKAARAELGRAMKETAKEYWNTSRTKKIGGAIARFAVKSGKATAGAFKGAASGAKASWSAAR